VIDKLAQDNNPEYYGLTDAMKKAANCRFREYIRETLAEY
jgi:hypothetical protein